MLNIGCINGKVYDDKQGKFIPIHFFYPTREIGKSEKFGPYDISVAMNASIYGNKIPLIVLSHGSGGSSLTYRELMCSLVKSGYAVLALEHPGNCYFDDSLAATLANLENRPRHIKLVIDHIVNNELVSNHLLKNKITLIGHSMGGYTALAISGGIPVAIPDKTSSQSIEEITVPYDNRISSLILLAPACGWFNYKDSLNRVNVPILLLTAEKDHLSDILCTSVIENHTNVVHKTVTNAGHHSFQSPFPSHMKSINFPPSQDPAGFDREKYQAILSAEIKSFLSGIYH
ncbi:putative dienelactone hydrolase [Xenorhabdus cabanillasii]|uniref:Putative dienelactone hydrolase n=1 Tax=Xenorhabdus cabanillasii TaxID=351673 RepID=A0A3D9UB25_9GAMM|nr:alpha/beta fold hydrolase [Xenorhabdus cabanillasii]REF26692.1 putative dienelactone hydrolase [Xenorhabdus cabanillasii]